jgi:uroporphyrinogen decarboxylase
MTAELTSVERIKRVLSCEEPDRVPHFEWLVDQKVQQALVPGCKSPQEFTVRMGLDVILVDPHFWKKQVGDDRWLSEWGFVFEYGLEEHGVEVESPIKTMEDFERYTPPDPHAPGRYAPIEEAVKEFKGKKAIGVHLNDVFSIPRYLMGMTNLLMAFITEPELVTALVNMSVDINLEMAKKVASLGVDFVHTGDDYAYNKGPLMSPRHFREFLYPGLCRAVGGFKELGLKVIKHTDGDIWPIIDMIVDSGIDCLDPIDILAGMDLGEVKEKFGHRIALKGNVDCVNTLTTGTTEEVIQETKEALLKGAPGGGYILSSSNSIHSGVNPQNYLTMLQTLEEYGGYPIRL